ncbi:hypothetical protein CYMTET_54853 [Cymbomonas tetramitiformis]|uniref:AAA+ ATPase domain-containing protein n=1 Tax=Cymbomonas tetramitiformis TaxID=36881 RepID=A0AAE0ENK1_9CHLO|nr:hypothetical protein CYMTET_54853 [Cymbomonas tetramitiformis]
MEGDAELHFLRAKSFAPDTRRAGSFGEASLSGANKLQRSLSAPTSPDPFLNRWLCTSDTVREIVEKGELARQASRLSSKSSSIEEVPQFTEKRTVSGESNEAYAALHATTPFWQELIQQSKEEVISVNSDSGVPSRMWKPPVGSALERMQDAICTFTDRLGQDLLERETECRLLVLATLVGEHLLLIGPPGTAKSFLARKVKHMCEGATYFERLLTKFSTPEELFGPLSVHALENDLYLRKREGFLTLSNIVFLDEIFKASSSILNTLLSVMNERLYDHGADRKKVPLMCLVGASNELPPDGDQDPLFDRFLLRHKVKGLTDKGWRQLGAPPEPPSDSTQSAKDIWSSITEAMIEEPEVPSLKLGDLETLRSAASHVKLSATARQLMKELRVMLQLQEPPIYVSDRRWKLAVKLLKVAAFTSGKCTVTEADCLLLRHCLVSNPKDEELVSNFISCNSQFSCGLEQVDMLLQSLEEQDYQPDPAADEEEQEEANQFLQVCREELDYLSSLVKTELAQIKGLKRDGLKLNSVWITESAVAKLTEVPMEVHSTGRTRAVLPCPFRRMLLEPRSSSLKRCNTLMEEESKGRHG